MIQDFSVSVGFCRSAWGGLEILWSGADLHLKQR